MALKRDEAIGRQTASIAIHDLKHEMQNKQPLRRPPQVFSCASHNQFIPVSLEVSPKTPVYAKTVSILPHLQTTELVNITMTSVLDMAR